MKPHHIYPVHDLAPHDTEGLSCHCRPEIRTDGDGVVIVVHRAFDCRDLLEMEKEREN